MQDIATQIVEWQMALQIWVFANALEVSSLTGPDMLRVEHPHAYSVADHNTTTNF